MDFARTIRSHGCAGLPPAIGGRTSDAYRTLLRLGEVPTPVAFTRRGEKLMAATPERLNATQRSELRAITRRMFRLDEDFSKFYDSLTPDDSLAWVRRGAGRLLCAPTVFEDVVKTICTTNCAWSGTVRMVSALVNGLGGGAFPVPERMARAPLRFYTEKARAGYRGPYLRALSVDVAAGRLDLEALRPGFGLGDDEVEARLRAIAGVGPYACAHIMLLLGRYRPLVLDSWTRPTYLRLMKKQKMNDAQIERRFRRYGDFAGLAFWLTVTADWLPVPPT